MVQTLVVYDRIRLKLETEFVSTLAVSWMLQSRTSTIILQLLEFSFFVTLYFVFFFIYLFVFFVITTRVDLAIATIIKEPPEVNKHSAVLNRTVA